MGFAGVGGGGVEVGCEDSVVPAGPRGWVRRLPIVFLLVLLSWSGMLGWDCFGDCLFGAVVERVM